MLEPTNMTGLVHGMTVSEQTLNIFYLFMFPAMAIFCAGVVVKLYQWTRGRPYRLRIPLKQLVLTFINNVLLQRQVLDLSLLRWVIHMAIFWGFLGLFAMSGVDFFLYEIVKIDDRTFLAFNILWFDSSQLFPQGVWPFVKGIANEAFGFVLLFGVVAAMARRFIARPTQLLSKYMDVLSLVWLLVMALSGFIMEGVRMVAQNSVGLENLELGGWLAAQGFLAFSQTPTVLTQGVYDLFWFFHIGAAIVFLVYSPFSKLVHVLTSPVSDFVNNLEEGHGEHLSRLVPLGEVIDEKVLVHVTPTDKKSGRG